MLFLIDHKATGGCSVWIEQELNRVVWVVEHEHPRQPSKGGLRDCSDNVSIFRFNSSNTLEIVRGEEVIGKLEDFPPPLVFFSPCPDFRKFKRGESPVEHAVINAVC